MARTPSPIAWAPEAQAVVVQLHCPLRPYLIATCPAAMLPSMMMPSSGFIFLTVPFSSSAAWLSIVDCRPPHPLPMQVPQRVASSTAMSMPACCHASCAATMAYCWYLSERRTSFFVMAPLAAGSQSLISASTWIPCRGAVSMRSMGPMWSSPATSASHSRSKPIPAGVTVPTPVMTTLVPMPMFTSPIRRRCAEPVP